MHGLFGGNGMHMHDRDGDGHWSDGRIILISHGELRSKGVPSEPLTIDRLVLKDESVQ